MAPRGKRTAREDAASPVLDDQPLCPFTGEKLLLIQHPGTGSWRAQGPFYFTRFYDFKEDLLHALGLRLGKEDPRFPPAPKITVRELTPPPANPLADQVEKGRQIQETVDEYVEVNKQALGLRK